MQCLPSLYSLAKFWVSFIDVRTGAQVKKDLHFVHKRGNKFPCLHLPVLFDFLKLTIVIRLGFLSMVTIPLPVKVYYHFKAWLMFSSLHQRCGSSQLAQVIQTWWRDLSETIIPNKLLFWTFFISRKVFNKLWFQSSWWWNTSAISMCNHVGGYSI